MYAAAAKSFQSCPTLCDPIDGSPPGSPIPGILQARALVRVAISFSNAWKWKIKMKSLSHVRLPAIPWTAAYQAPPSMGFSRHKYWSGLPFPSPFFQCVGSLNLLWGYKLDRPKSFFLVFMEKAMAPHSSTLAWKIPWTEEPGRLQSMGSLRVRHDWATSLSLFTFMHWRRK